MAGTTPRKKKSVKQLLSEAQRAVRTVDVCTRADLVDEAERLEARIERAKASAGDSLAGAPDVSDLDARLAELKEEMADASITFKIRGLAERKYTQLIAQHPPRAGNDGDKAMGFHVDDVVEQLIRLGTEEPKLDLDDWTLLLEDVLNKATYAQLTNAAWAVNARDVSVPF